MIGSLKVALVVLLLLGLPLVGVILAGKPVELYLEFPPTTRYVEHEPFSWPVFLGLTVFILSVISPFVVRISSFVSGLTFCEIRFTLHERRASARAFPWWGWSGLAWVAVWWVVAWTRFPWMAGVQEHTFTPLWLGYILVLNAWTFRRTGHCMMLHRPRYFLSLFPLSAAFWWFFEYLNRFVQNWYYVGVAELSPLEYFLRATIPFSTVLPAVIGTAELLASFPRLSAGLEQVQPVRVANFKLVGWVVLALSSAGLMGLGLWPNYLFPLVWVGPLLLILSLHTLKGQPFMLATLARGDWRLIGLPAIAALICGFFWELWNWKSLAHWEYTIPFVHRFQLFEMPFLGYAGYLPFGLECLVVADLCLSRKFSGGVEYYRTHENRP